MFTVLSKTLDCGHIWLWVVWSIIRGLVRLSQSSLNSFIISLSRWQDRTETVIFLIEIFCKCSPATNGFNNATQFFCLCLCLCPDIKVWTCYVQISALKWGFTLNFQTQRQREGDKHFILGALLISSTALDWALLSALPHHIHIITQQLILFPKSQHLELHRENPIGAARFSICFSVWECSRLPLSPSSILSICFLL